MAFALLRTPPNMKTSKVITFAFAFLPALFVGCGESKPLASRDASPDIGGNGGSSAQGGSRASGGASGTGGKVGTGGTTSKPDVVDAAIDPIATGGSHATGGTGGTGGTPDAADGSIDSSGAGGSRAPGGQGGGSGGAAGSTGKGGRGGAHAGGAGGSMFPGQAACESTGGTCMLVSGCDSSRGHLGNVDCQGFAGSVCCIPLGACGPTDKEFLCCDGSAWFRPTCVEGQLVCDAGKTRC
jgi:hypothetical protein